MKKVFLTAALAVLSMSALFAQNNFRGTIVYSATSTGETPLQIPAEYATAEVKLFDNKATTSSTLFTNSQMVNSVLVDGNNQTNCMDLSMIMMFLQQNEVELDYNGPSKILVKHTYTQQDIDSLTIPVTEGFYIEYVNGETRTICGVEAKKAIFHVFDEEGDDHPMTVWYNETMGPANNFLFNGIHGVALEFTRDMGEGRQLTLTATEIKKGKVKEVDMYLPSGYEEIPNETLEALFKQIAEEMEYLNE